MTVLFFRHDEPTEVKVYDTIFDVFDNECYMHGTTVVDPTTGDVFVYDEESICHKSELITEELN